METCMEHEKHSLTRAEVLALKSRWHAKAPDSEETVLTRMIRRLKTECIKQRSPRSVRLDLRGISLLNEDLSGLDLSGYDLSYANLNQSNLSGTVLSHASFHKASLEQATLDECEFIGSDLTHASLNECSAKRCGFGGADLSYANMINADLSAATLSRSKLIQADLRASNLQNARLSEADLSGAIFTRATLSESDLKKWHLEGGDLAQLEREVLPWDHAEVATWICSEWGLPENIALSIRNHHNPDVDSNHETLGPVRLVSILREDDSNNGLGKLIDRAESAFNISAEKMQSLIEPSFEKAKDLAHMIV